MGLAGKEVGMETKYVWLKALDKEGKRAQPMATLMNGNELEISTESFVGMLKAGVELR